MASNNSTIRDDEVAIDPEELIPSDQAASVLRQKPQTLALWRYEKRGPAWLKVGRLVFYRRVDIAKWLATRRCDPAAARERV